LGSVGKPRTEEAIEMDIPTDAQVYCDGELCGRSTYVIVNPVTDEVTHLVVEQESFPPTDRLVSVDLIMESMPHRILLRCTKGELSKMPPFTETEFISPTDGEMYPLMMWPYAVPESAAMTLEHERIPPGELAVRRGARVQASDGHVGQVDEFLVDPETCHITHLVMREGHLWGAKDVAVPVSEIVRIDEDTVHLRIDKASIEALPVIAMRRAWRKGA
jgi:sporulation protein YlmC with PRC-barrel domain